MSGEDMQAVSVHLDAATLTELDRLARRAASDRSSLISEAVDAYLAEHRRQLAEIEEGIRQADAGELATEAEVEAVFAKYR